MQTNATSKARPPAEIPLRIFLPTANPRGKTKKKKRLLRRCRAKSPRWVRSSATYSVDHDPRGSQYERWGPAFGRTTVCLELFRVYEDAIIHLFCCIFRLLDTRILVIKKPRMKRMSASPLQMRQLTWGRHLLLMRYSRVFMGHLAFWSRGWLG